VWFGQLEPDEPSTAIITIAGLQQLLARVGYYGDPSEAFARWGETNLPHTLRPYGIVLDAEGAHINPPEALDILIDHSRSRESPLKALFWSTLAATLGAIVYVIVQKRMG
jgi:hypothetical protein